MNGIDIIINAGDYISLSQVAVVAIEGVGDLDAQFEGASVARTVPADIDPVRVVELAVEMSNAPDRSSQARALAERYYSLEKGIESYAALYRSLGVEPTARGIDPCA